MVLNVSSVRMNDAGSAVLQLQQLLRGAGYKMTVDGTFGPQTEAAVRDFQKRVGLVVDGVAGPRTVAALKGSANRRHLRQDELVLAAQRLGVDLASMHAVAEVESRGEGFLPDGRPQILFERHIFMRRLKELGINVAPYMRIHPDLVNSAPGGYEGGAKEHERLQVAMGISRGTAIESASWGRFQIMGFHWKTLGYHSAHGWQSAMEESEGLQLEAFVRFVQADRRLLAALQQKNWSDFARIYNGPDYRRNSYDLRLSSAWQRHAQKIEQEKAT